MTITHRHWNNEEGPFDGIRGRLRAARPYISEISLISVIRVRDPDPNCLSTSKPNSLEDPIHMLRRLLGIERRDLPAVALQPRVVFVT